MPPPVEPLLPDSILTGLRLALLTCPGLPGAGPGPLRPLVADALNNRGVMATREEDRTAALALFNTALAIMPRHAQALNNRGAVLTELGRAAEALDDFTRTLALRPGNPNAWSNQGNAFAQLGRFVDSVDCYDKALAIDAGHFDARLNRGISLQALRRFDEALADFAQVRALAPEHVVARYNSSLVHLAVGDFAAGWTLHEARWGLSGMRADWRDFPQPRLTRPEEADGKTVLLWPEQGLGDVLQFCRYATLLAQRARVIVEAPSSLVRLLRSLPGVARVVAMGETLPAFDLQCPMMSLPLVFGTRLETIPGAVPYLRAEPERVAAWRERMATLPGLHVGLVWAGNPRPTDPSARAIDARRSMRLAQLARLADVPGVSLVSLQKYAPGAVVEAVPAGMALHDWTGELEDFADTAALIEALDLVITVDTAVVHLAGALGKPVWILNRFDACWRWLDGRRDSPWYPTARLFKQASAGDWAGVVAEVAQALGQSALQRLHDQANAEMQQGRWTEALRTIDAILRATPDSVRAQVNRATALDHLGQTEAAVEGLGRALAIDPTYRLAHRNRGVALYRLGRWRAALADFDAVLRVRPDDADALMQRGGTQYKLGDSEAALADLRAAAALRPDHAATLTNLGLALETSDQLEAALDHCDRALAVDPGELDAWVNRGVVLHRMRRFADALACFDHVAARRPDDANADYNASLIHLAQGDYAKGWARHEARWRTDNLRAAARGFAQPLWRGEAIAPGQTILLHAEQGLGDTLQFCRYVPLVAAKADVVLEVPAPLVRLLGGLPGVRVVVAQGDVLPAFDLQCPLLSLPLAFGTTVKTIPGTVPYLKAEPKAVAVWRRKLKPLEGRRVGLVWAGRARANSASLHAVDRRRSMKLADFAPLAEVPGVAFVSLQKGPDVEQVRPTPAGMVLHDWTEELEDFADTAALVAALDLVITVDTSVAHLAGALGKPVWVLNRFDACWRWLDGRADSPWYPSARLFRQRVAGDWGTVVAEVAAALRELPQRKPRVAKTRGEAR